MYQYTQFSFLASLRFLSFALLLMALSFSCEKEQYQPEQEEEQEQEPYQEPPCELGQCQNGSVCLDGTCDCPDGFAGKFCEFRTGSFRDSRDNKIYRWVTLRDGKKWMASNLYFSGSGVAALSGNSAIYGYFYPWHSIMQGEESSGTNPSGVRGICPEGWHIPSPAEWTFMAEQYGGHAEDAENNGKAAYFALVNRGYSGLNLQLGGFHSGYDWVTGSEGGSLSSSETGHYSTSLSDGVSPVANLSHSISLEGAAFKYNTFSPSAISCRCVED
jgi:uncharacterized protein (TIGR02145 family)